MRETVGENNIRGLINSFVDSSSTDWTVHYLTPGWSGASVLRITGQKDILLKISNKKKSLLRELDKYPDIGDSFREIFVTYNTSKSAESPDGEWYAIAATFRADSITMTDRIRTCYNRGDLNLLLKDFFINGLEPVYRNTSINGGNQHIFDALMPRIDRIARIHLSI